MKNVSTRTLVALMLCVFVGSSTLLAKEVHGATTSELYAQIQSLTQQIKLLQEIKNLGNGNQSGVCAQAFTRTLALGSTGADVLALQRFLNRDTETKVALYGAGAMGLETSYYGVRTQEAVNKFQNKYRSSNSQVMQSGVVDSATRIQLHALCTNINGDAGSPSETNTNLEVTRGSEHDSTISEGDTGTLYEVDIQTDGTSQTLDTLSFEFSKDPERYIESFELYKDGSRVKTVQSDKRTRVDNMYRLTISDIGSSLPKNETTTYALRARVKNSLSSSLSRDSVTVTIPARGIALHSTNSSTRSLPQNDLESRTFDFDNSSNNGSDTTTLRISEASDSLSDSDIAVSGNNETRNVTVLKTDFEARDTAVDITDIYLMVESDHDDPRDIIKSLTLRDENTTLETASITYSNSNELTERDENGDRVTVVPDDTYYVHFENISDLTIRKDDTSELSVRADFSAQTNSSYDDNTEVTITLIAVVADGPDDARIVQSELTIGEDTTFTLQTE